MTNLKYLGTKTEMQTRELDTIPSPRNTLVRFETDELTTHCPVTGHPDFNTLAIEYHPDRLGIESKSLKLYVESWRGVGAFCEQLAEMIAQEVYDAIHPHWCRVTVEQHTRGGIRLTAVSELPGV